MIVLATVLAAVAVLYYVTVVNLVIEWLVQEGVW